MKVAVVGGNGFIGSAVGEALRRRGHHPFAVSAPRLHASGREVSQLLEESSRLVRESAALEALFEDADAVVNAAGIADASSTSHGALFGANAVLPRLIVNASVAVGVARVVHVSSSGVQGRMARLDESTRVAPINPYTCSKALGEALLRDCPSVTIFRPTSVHAETRAITRRLVRFMGTRAASVAGRGDRPTPQVLVENVGDAISEVVLGSPPRVVMQPSEGLTTGLLAELLGGHQPLHLPERVARLTIKAMYSASSALPVSSANVRRLEMLWFGQEQDEGWLLSIGWRPPVDVERWAELGAAVRKQV